MNLQNVLNDYTTNGLSLDFQLVLTLAALMFAILTIVSKNTIVSVLFLIGLFVSISLYLISLGLYFVGLAYILVYVGAVSILFIFILMLINIRMSELVTQQNNSLVTGILSVFTINNIVSPFSPYHTYLATTVSILFFYLSVPVLYVFNLFYTITGLDSYVVSSPSIASDSSPFELSKVNSCTWDISIIDNNHITAMGNIMYSNLSILLFITAAVLLVAMIGTIGMTFNKETKQTHASFFSLFALSLFF